MESNTMKSLYAVSALTAAVLIAVPVCLSAEPAPATAAAQPAAASRPAASQPASEIVLVRVGPTVITQEDFNREASQVDPRRLQSGKASIMHALVGQRLLQLYLDEHPELVDESKLEAMVQDVLKKEGVETREELLAKLRAQGVPDKLDYYLNKARLMVGRAEIRRRAARSEEELKKIFDKDPSAFNGTARFVCQIRISRYPWETPEQVRAKREKAERIREDLVSGRRSWEECLVESDCPSRMTGGELGYVHRHLEQPDVVGEAAFRLDVGEISEVLEDRRAFYIIKVTKKHKGGQPFEQAKVRMRLWQEWAPLSAIDQEMRAKYEIVGVREPELPPLPASMPESATAPAPRSAQVKPPAQARQPATAPARAAVPQPKR